MGKTPRSWVDVFRANGVLGVYLQISDKPLWAVSGAIILLRSSKGIPEGTLKTTSVVAYLVLGFFSDQCFYIFLILGWEFPSSSATF